MFKTSKTLRTAAAARQRGVISQNGTPLNTATRAYGPFSHQSVSPQESKSRDEWALLQMMERMHVKQLLHQHEPPLAPPPLLVKRIHDIRNADNVQCIEWTSWADLINCVNAVDPAGAISFNAARRQWCDDVAMFFKNQISEMLGNRHGAAIVFPSGSRNLTSDIDVQISLDVCQWKDTGGEAHLKSIGKIAALVEGAISFARDVWLGLDLTGQLDINYYPPTIINFGKNLTCVRELYPAQCMYVHVLKDPINQTEDTIVVWRPRFGNAEEDIEFLAADLFRSTLSQATSNVTQYNAKDLSEIGLVEGNLIKMALDAKGGTAVGWNRALLEVVQYNPIGPEMYFCVCTIIFVVLFMQMQSMQPGDIPLAELRKIACVAAVENYFHFKHSGKAKYALRAQVALMLIDPGEFDIILNSAKKGRPLATGTQLDETLLEFLKLPPETFRQRMETETDRKLRDEGNKDITAQWNDAKTLWKRRRAPTLQTAQARPTVVRPTRWASMARRHADLGRNLRRQKILSSGYQTNQSKK